MDNNFPTSNVENRYVEEEKGFKKERSTFIGLIFGLVFAIIGTIPWIAVGVMGYFASYCGFIISFCAVKGYTMYTHKKSVFSGVMLIVICLFAFLFALYLTDVIVIYKEMKEDGVDIVLLFQSLYQFIFSDPEYLQDFLKNGVLGLIFLVLGMRRPLGAFFSAHAEIDEVA